MINIAIRLSNDLVMVFNENDEQLREYQGNYIDVKQRIIADASPGTRFAHWSDDAEEPQTVPLEYW